MVNPEDSRTTINVKSVRASAWERARKAAIQSGEAMGSWLSDTVDYRLDREGKTEIIAPGLPGANLPADAGNPAISLPDLASVLTTMRALEVPIQKRVGRELNAMLYDYLRSGRGLPGGKEISGIGQSANLVEG